MHEPAQASTGHHKPAQDSTNLHWCTTRIFCFGALISGFDFRLWFQVFDLCLDFRFCFQVLISGFRFQVSDFRFLRFSFQVLLSGVRWQALDFRFLISDFDFRTNFQALYFMFGIQMLFSGLEFKLAFQVFCFGFQMSGSMFQVFYFWLLDFGF